MAAAEEARARAKQAEDQSKIKTEDPSMLQSPGASDGATKVIKEEGGIVAAYAWSEGRVGTFHVIQSRTRVMGWYFSRYSVQNSGYGLVIFTLFCKSQHQLVAASPCNQTDSPCPCNQTETPGSDNPIGGDGELGAAGRGHRRGRALHVDLY
jgi:hypothetical protein